MHFVVMYGENCNIVIAYIDVYIAVLIARLYISTVDEVHRVMDCAWSPSELAYYNK